jgi:hypothetical protein
VQNIESGQYIVCTLVLETPSPQHFVPLYDIDIYYFKNTEAKTWLTVIDSLMFVIQFLLLV